MNCFNHPNIPAVGICKYCQKGLCMECALDLGHGIACKNHREEVEIRYSTSGIYTQMFYIFGPLGIIMILSGILTDNYMNTKEPALFFIGTGMLGFGGLYSVVSGILAIKWLRKSK